MASNKDFRHQEFEIQRDLWAVFKNHYNDMEQADADQAYAEFNAICTKYGETDFCCEMAVAMVNQLMRRWNENHGKVSES